MRNAVAEAAGADFLFDSEFDCSGLQVGVAEGPLTDGPMPCRPAAVHGSRHRPKAGAQFLITDARSC